MKNSFVILFIRHIKAHGRAAKHAIADYMRRRDAYMRSAARCNSDGSAPLSSFEVPAPNLAGC